MLARLGQLAARIERGDAPVAEIPLVENHATRVMRDWADEAVQILGAAEEVLNDLAARPLGVL